MPSDDVEDIEDSWSFASTEGFFEDPPFVVGVSIGFGEFLLRLLV